MLLESAIFGYENPNQLPCHCIPNIYLNQHGHDFTAQHGTNKKSRNAHRCIPAFLNIYSTALQLNGLALAVVVGRGVPCHHH